MDVIFEATKVMDDIMRAGIRVYWLDPLIRNIHEEWECQELVQQVTTLRVQVKESEKCLNKSNNLLKQAKEMLEKKNLDPTLVENYAKKVSKVLVPRISLLNGLPLTCRFLFFPEM